MTSDFPTTLADLVFDATSQTPSLYTNLKRIRKSTLSIPNRLRSILEDSRFAKEVADHYNLPLVANERCGSWYIDPADRVGSAYFKSTDGHHGQWDFSARRLNLQLLQVLAAHGGAVVVDSTRRGKYMPDAFSKTVPIWAAVINRAMFPEMTSMHHLKSPASPCELGLSEISQIEARLDAFTNTFCSLGLDLPNLRRQLRRPVMVSWAINGLFDADTTYTRGLDDLPYHRLVLCSASRRVLGSEVSEGGYIQGAGDDSESWSYGLTAPLFWAHKDMLEQTVEGNLPSLIEELVQEEAQSSLPGLLPTRILPASNIHIFNGSIDHMEGFDLIVNSEGDTQDSMPGIVRLKCRSGKLGSKDLRENLPMAVGAISSSLLKNPQSQIVITCSTGRDLSVGVAVAALCLLYNDQGESSSRILVRTV
jgi:tRNA A64-2'-O-ribosylphosphate transferase